MATLGKDTEGKGRELVGESLERSGEPDTAKKLLSFVKLGKIRKLSAAKNENTFQSNIVAFL